LNLKACSSWSLQAHYQREVAQREQVRTMADAMVKTVEEGERGQMQEG